MSDFWIYGLAVLAVISWLLAVVEMIGTIFFWRRVFEFGPRVFSEERALARHVELDLQPDTRFGTSSAAFRVVSPSEILFRPKLSPFHSLLFKGTLTLRGDRASAAGRVSLGVSLLLLMWLAGQFYESFILIMRPDDVPNVTGMPAPLFALVSFPFLAAVLWLFVGLARRSARRAFDEFARRDKASA